MNILNNNTELPLAKNPYKKISDYIPPWLKIFWKETILPIFLQPHHHLIIPFTQNHTSWTLGAQPTEKTIKKIYHEEGVTEAYDKCGNLIDQVGGQKKVHLISLLTKSETLITTENKYINKTDRISWFDHGSLNAITGKNQTVAKMVDYQNSLHAEFLQKPSSSIFYCHCMAGKSRSLVATITFLYFYPAKEKLFDFSNWPEKIITKLKKKSPDLLKRLPNNPTLTDIAEFVKLQRPVVKKISDLEGDQAGFLGLLALHKNAASENLMLISKRETQSLYREAQNIGLMLKAPLDLSFREESDRTMQENSLLKVYLAYQERKINLLTAMLVPINIKKNVSNPEKYFNQNFANLSPNEQARFSILVKKLRDRITKKTATTEFEKPLDNPLFYAQIAMKNAKKISAGDQIELLKSFGSLLKIKHENVIKKILKGNSCDRYNADIKLFELLVKV